MATEQNAFLTDKPSGGTSTDFTKFRESIANIAQRTTDIPETQAPSTSGFSMPVKGFQGIEQQSIDVGSDPRIKAALQTFKSQVGSLKDRANQQAEAIKLRSAGFEQSITNLEAIQAEQRATAGDSTEKNQEAIDKAAQYVQDTRRRALEVRQLIQDTAKDMTQERSSAKAHSAQVAVQGVMGKYAQEEKRVAQSHGTDSAEYAQLQDEKQIALATVGSEIQTAYHQMAEAQDQNILAATVGAEEKMNMYTGFQEQQHVETILAVAKSTDLYNIQAAQWNVGIEQLKMAQYNDMADYMASIPDFYVDTSPLVALMSEVAGEKFAQMEAIAARSQETALANQAQVTALFPRMNKYSQSLVTRNL